MTVLAPLNDGFRQLGARLGLRQRELLSSKPMLCSVLRQHLLPGRWFSHELPWGGTLRTAEGRLLAVSALGLIGQGDAGQPLLGGSDLRARNGVLHRLAVPLALI
jgi:hypothetical protein